MFGVERRGLLIIISRDLTSERPRKAGQDLYQNVLI